jgi:AcrR family transcriptional regulator
VAPKTGGQAAPKPRRRGEALEAALLDAAWEELRSAGYRDLTVEAVADRAGTSRAVVYRRWRNKAELVIAALRRHQPMLSDQIPDTGNLRDDVLAVLRRMSNRMAETGSEIVFGLLGDYLADPELFGQIQGQILSIGTGVMATILERAAARGEAGAEVAARVATLPTDLFRQELFLHRAPPAEPVLLEIVDQVFLPLVRLAP